MDNRHFILDGERNPVPVPLLEWAKWFETGDRRVSSTELGEYLVSTVFLGLDHRFGGGGPPLLFETMVFKRSEGALDLDMQRYSTWAEAEAGHEEMCLKWGNRRG